jgi:hypothetical protein
MFQDPRTFWKKPGISQVKFLFFAPKEVAEALLGVKMPELKEIEEFKEEFVEKVYELLKEWYPKRENLDNFLQQIRINEKGRVEIERLDMSYCDLSFLYLPSLFEKIKEFNCVSNKLTFLPELPDEVEWIDCSSNQLTSLPQITK